MLRNIILVLWAFAMGQNLSAQDVGSTVAACAFSVNYTIYHPTCPGEENGSIELAVSNAVGAVSYEWLNVDQPNASTTEMVDALHAGNYKVRIADNICADTLNFDVVDPAPLEFDLIAEAVSCIGDLDGSVTVETTVDDGSIDSYNIDYGITDQTSNIFDNLEPGEHTMIVTDINGCVSEETFIIEEPEEPIIEFEKNDVSCPGGNDASFIVIIETVSGLQDEYQYSLDGDIYQQSPEFDNLEAGEYEVYTKNLNACIFQKIVIISEPEERTVEHQKNNVTCPGGNDASFIVIIETVSGLQEDYEYSLDGIAYQLDSVFHDLEAGFYEAFARNTDGCVFESPVLIEIEEPDEPVMDFEKNNVTCPGGNDASFIVIIETVSGLQEDYEYSLDGIAYQLDSVFHDLEAGFYEAFARNTDGCVFESPVLIEIEEPDEPVMDFEKNDVTCPGGNDASFIVIIETVSGLQEDYEYSLDGIAYQLDSVFHDLEAGFYEAFARNADGCVFESPVLIEIEEPEIPSLDFIKEDVTCPGGNDASFIVIIETVSGLQEDYDFSIDNGLTFQADSTFNGLDAGIYNVVARNGSNCLFTTTIEITEPNASVYALESTDVSCAGGHNGSINIEILSGVPPYEYSLDGINYQSSNTFEGLSAGGYEVYVSDGNGCISSGSVTIDEPTKMGIQINGGNETCDYDNGWASVAAEGGISPYDYDWSNGSKDPFITELPEATYYITITDLLGCQLTDSVFIINEAAPEIDELVQHVTCYGEANGWISLFIESESYPLKYIWSNGEIRDQTVNLEAGFYSVTVIDVNNCYTSKEVEVEEPEALQINAEIGFAKNKGSINLEVNGGTAPFQYQWSDNSTEEDPQAISFGIYAVTVTDAMGCEEKAAFRIFDPTAPTGDHINVYPVPTFEEVNIEIFLPEEAPVQVYLLDELGRELRRSPESIIENDVLTLNLEQLPAALYLLRIHVGDEIVVKRIVKQTD